jgi:FkbH-like protein
MTSNPFEAAQIRDEFLSFLERGETLRAIQAARTLLAEEGAIRQWNFIRTAVDKTPVERLSLKPFRVALLSSFSIDFIHPALVAYGLLNRLRLEIYQSEFSQFRQQILNPRSALYSFAPDAVVLAVEGKDWFPSLYHDYLGSMKSGVEGISRSARDDVAALVAAFRKQSQAALLIHNFAPPTWPQLGIADGREETGQVQNLYRLNEALQALSRDNPGIYIVDYAALVCRYGALHWYDERMDHYAKAPIAQNMLGHLSSEYMKYFRSLSGQAKKCLVLDLDDTLWGGVLGEEGISGIQLGPNYPGSAFVAFQQAVLNLRTRGVILAVASKNNPADVEEVFSFHPHMVLKREHFSSMQINWKPKSESVKEITRELGIGLEHVVVADDNPTECSQILSVLPEVTAITLPKQPELYARALLDEGLFDVVSFSQEDTRRGELYQQRAQADALREQSRSLENFYRSLGMEVSFAPVVSSSLARAAQLTQKTNQFNVTTIRYSELQLSRLISDPDWQLTTVRVRDRFGDNGIVGLVLTHLSSGQLEIDTFLLSCRVIGRTVESAMLAYVCDFARRRGIRTIRGRVHPTAKNMPARDIFDRHGFQRTAGSENEVSTWVLDVEQHPVPWPEWIRVVPETLPGKAGDKDLRSIGVENAGAS